MTPSPITPMLQMQFAQSPSLGQRLQGMGTNLTAAAPALKAGANALMPGATPPAPNPGEMGSPQAGPIAPGGQMPLPGMPGTAVAGPVAPPPAPGAGPQAGAPSLLDAIKGMQPQQIMDVLRNASRQGVNVLPTGAPGSSAMQSAGMLPSTYGG